MVGCGWCGYKRDLIVGNSPSLTASCLRANFVKHLGSVVASGSAASEVSEK